jgi:hypothetical protein
MPEPTVSTDAQQLPFVAPCRPLPAGAPLDWIRLGWQDYRRAPRPCRGRSWASA